MPASGSWSVFAGLGESASKWIVERGVETLRGAQPTRAVALVDWD